jgi:hypothetical protein
MVAVGLYVALQANPGMEEEVATFLRGADQLPLSNATPGGVWR